MRILVVGQAVIRRVEAHQRQILRNPQSQLVGCRLADLHRVKVDAQHRRHVGVLLIVALHALDVAANDLRHVAAGHAALDVKKQIILREAVFRHRVGLHVAALALGDRRGRRRRGDQPDALVTEAEQILRGLEGGVGVVASDVRKGNSLKEAIHQHQRVALHGIVDDTGVDFVVTVHRHGDDTVGTLIDQALHKLVLVLNGGIAQADDQRAVLPVGLVRDALQEALAEAGGEAVHHKADAGLPCREPFLRHLCIRKADKGTSPRKALDQALVGQHHHGLFDRDAAETIERFQLRLGGKAILVAVLSVQDFFFDVVVHAEIVVILCHLTHSCLFSKNRRQQSLQLYYCIPASFFQLVISNKNLCRFLVFMTYLLFCLVYCLTYLLRSAMIFAYLQAVASWFCFVRI